MRAGLGIACKWCLRGCSRVAMEIDVIVDGWVGFLKLWFMERHRLRGNCKPQTVAVLVLPGGGGMRAERREKSDKKGQWR